MLDFPKWKIWLVILTLFIGCAYAVPSFLPEKITAQACRRRSRRTSICGLDLAGGSYLLLEAEDAEVAKQQRPEYGRADPHGTAQARRAASPSATSRLRTAGLASWCATRARSMRRSSASAR